MGKAPRQKGHKNYGRQGKKLSRYLSRSAALSHLQIPLARFRQLCILKGVYPRDVKGSNGTFYSRLDIAYLSRDPLIDRFRQWRKFMRRYVRARDKQWDDKAQRMAENAQVKFKYDSIVKERYPTLQSALGDLDDCLTLLFLFARMPSQHGISSKLLAKIKRACDEFCTYVALTKSLRKVFLSFKGIYYQANILGQTVTWVVPYDFPHVVPSDVDFSVFHTFIQFYETLQAFVNFKLFAAISIPYPPESVQKDAANSMILDLQDETDVESMLDRQGVTEAQREIQAETEARLRGLEGKLKSIAQSEKLREETSMQYDSDMEDEDDGGGGDDGDEDEDGRRVVDVPGVEDRTDEETVDELMTERYKNMFKGLVFFISRECPRGPLEFLLRSFGGKVGWNTPDSKISRDDERITHEIVDRPNLSDMRNDREYVQPQWVFDCVNAHVRLPVEPYGPGNRLPPHLSPFVEYEPGSYVPKYALEIRKLVEMEKAALLNKGTAGSIIAVEDEEHDVVDDEDEEQEEDMYQRELHAEKIGKKFSELQTEIAKEKEERERDAVLNPSKARKAKTAKERREEEELNLKEMMMSQRTHKRYTKELRRREQKAAEVASLKKRRLLIEMEEEKVERERKEKSERLNRENALFNMKNEEEALKLIAEHDAEDKDNENEADDDSDDDNEYGGALGGLDDLSSASEDEDDGFDFDDINVDEGSDNDSDSGERRPAKQQPTSTKSAKKQKQHKNNTGKKRKHQDVSIEKQISKKKKARK